MSENAQPEPWTPAKLAAILTAGAYEHYCEGPGTVTLHRGAQSETYRVLSNEDGDVLTFERESDGARFDVEFAADVAALADGPDA